MQYLHRCRYLMAIDPKCLGDGCYQHSRLVKFLDLIDVPFSPKLLHTIRGMGYVMEVRETESEGEGAAL